MCGMRHAYWAWARTGKPRKYHHWHGHFFIFPFLNQFLSCPSLSPSLPAFLLPFTQTHTHSFNTLPIPNQIQNPARVRVFNSPPILPLMHCDSRALPWTHLQCMDTPSPSTCLRRSLPPKATTAPALTPPSTPTTTFTMKLRRSMTVPLVAWLSSRMSPPMRSMSLAVEGPKSLASLRWRFVAKFTSLMPLRLIRCKFPLSLSCLFSLFCYFVLSNFLHFVDSVLQLYGLQLYAFRYIFMVFGHSLDWWTVYLIILKSLICFWLHLTGSSGVVTVGWMWTVYEWFAMCGCGASTESEGILW